MPLPESITEKMKRAVMLFEEMVREIETYYNTDPGELSPDPKSTSSEQRYIFKEKDKVPPIISLIFGDCLQSVRSTLDYLVWELVEAAGNKPTKHNMFPIALTETAYRDDVRKRHRLDGVDPAAAAIIDTLQPYVAPQTEVHPLAALDGLVNITKHRRLVLTNLSGSDAIPDYKFPHMRIIVRVRDQTGRPIRELPFWAYLVVNDGLVKEVEITVCMNELADYVGNQVLPLFQRFFE